MRPSGSPPFWTAGEVVAWTYRSGHGDWVLPVTVVRDDGDALVAWLAAGTPMLAAVRTDGRPLRADPATMFTAERVQVETVWRDHHNLRIHQPGRDYSTYVFFDGTTGAFEGWYVNIEDPHTRDDRATYSRDHVLDVWVEPDRTIERKDEDELVLAVEQGRYTESEAEAITAVADEVESVVRAWESPFCDGWETFRPDPAWPVPTLAQVLRQP